MTKTKESNQFVKKEFPVQKIEIEAGAYSDTLGVEHPEPFADLIDAFGLHTWVYSCANLIANAFSMIEFIPYLPKSEGAWEINEKHPFRKLLNRPNPAMSGMELKRLVSLSSKLTGNAFIICDPAGSRTPTEIWPLQPHKVTVKPDAKNLIAGYVYNVNGHTKSFPVEQVIHVREATPRDLQYGQGSLTAVKNAVTADMLADGWNRYFFGNNGRPDAILQSDAPISPEAQKKVAEAWKKSYGGPKNRGKVAILSGMKYQEINRLHKDMDFVNLRKMLREEILAAFGVPQSMVGILDQANYSNMKEQTKTFWTQTMIPEIRKFESVLTLRAAQITGDDKTIIQADLSTVEALRADEQARASVAQTYVNIGIPLDQVIKALDLPFDASKIEPKEKPKPEPGPTDEEADSQTDDEDETKDGEEGKKAMGTNQDLDMVWKRFDRALVPHEQAFTGSLRAYFRAQKKRVMDKFEDMAGKLVPKDVKAIKAPEDQVGYFFNFEKERDLFGKVVDRKIRKAYFDFAVDMANRLTPGISFSVDERAAGQWIASKVLKLQQDVTRFTQEQLTDAVVESIRDAVSTGLSQSETIDQIRERILETYDFAVESRAERIARTETVGAANAGAMQAIKESSAPYKTWVTSRDDRVRDVHAFMDGKTIKKDESFVTPDGETLMFPGDPNGGPGAIINCRCNVVATFDD